MRSLILSAGIALAGFVSASAVANACETAKSAMPKVEQVYPTADKLPENLLRFYIYFSEPMAREGIWKSVLLLDEDKKVVPGAFIENKFDLWSPDDKRLTVLFDPGRVKTGLVAHNTLGRALDPGKTYHLQVNASAKTRAGCVLAQTYNKTFSVSEADFDAPDLAAWKITAPATGSKEPLRVALDGFTDHLSLAYRIRVKDAQGKPVRGSLRLDNYEKTWIFTPQKPWKKAQHQLEVNTTLEDIVGNRLTGLFDRPIVKDGFSEPAPDVEVIPFTPN